MKNLNLLFNKCYFSDIEKPDFGDRLKARNQEICGAVFGREDYGDIDEAISPQAHRFRMKTTYPGLLVGTGYAHEAEKGADQCVKLGFSFDYVTGQPYVPGSSVKGMLKSCFTLGAAGEVLQAICALPDAPSKEAMDALETNIFGGPEGDGRDIFFDAVLRSGDQNGLVMAQDYITPHGRGKEETKNPTPLMMMKVRPGVTFEFRFQLHDFEAPGLTVSAVQKKELFQTLVSLFGVGAKTDVGYGALVPADGTEAAQRPAQAGPVQQPAAPRNKPCPGCKKKNAVPPGKIVCPACEEKARKTQKCAICQRNKPAPLFGSDHLCATCIVQYKP